MITEEKFDDILHYLSSNMGISPIDILSKCKRAEVVDARVILIKILSDKGYYKRFIADKLNISITTIRYSLHSFDDRMKYNRNFKIIYKNVSENVP